MKRRIICLLITSVFLVIAFFLVCHIRNSQADVTFGVISDIHYADDETDVQRRKNTRKALQYYKSQNVDLIYLNGDVSDLGGLRSYEKIVEDIESIFPDEQERPIFIINADNHEYFEAWSFGNHIPTTTFEELEGRFCRALAKVRGTETGINCKYKINGYHFIGISSNGMNGAQASYSDETKAFLEDAIKEAIKDNPDKPIFVGVHQPPKDTVLGSDVECSVELNSVFEQYPQVVLFTSHTHCTLMDERSIWQGEYTAVNTGGMYYLNSYFDYEIGHQFAQGLLVRVRGNKVDIERYDFWNDEIIKENWKIKKPSSVETFTYTDNRIEKRKAPIFKSSTKVEVVWKDESSAKLKFKAAKHSDYVHAYRILIYENGVLLREEELSSNYFLGLERMPEVIETTINELDNTADYEFVITAIESFGKESEAVMGNLSGDK